MANGTVSYVIKDMRALRPEGKVKDKNPDRFMTVYGSEFRTLNADGKPSADPLSITSKVIDNDVALDPAFAIDLKKGTLTLPEGRRGRSKADSITTDDLNAALNELRSAQGSAS